MQATSLSDAFEQLKSDFLSGCTRCGLCVEICPLYPLAPWDGLTPAQLQSDRMSILDERRVSDAGHQFTFACSNCGACKRICPEGLDAFRLAHLLRWASREAGYPPPENPGAKPPDDPASLNRVCIALQTKPGEERWITSVPENPPQADTVLFLGCNVLAMPDKVNALIDILDTMGMNIPVVSGTRLCCGALDMLGGDLDRTESQLRVLIGELARYRPKEVINWCNGCHIKATQDAPLFMDVPFKSRHVSSFLNEHRHRLRFQQPLDRTVTVHDACGLGRILGEYEDVRELLAAIPGLKLVEMSKNRAEAPCCGVSLYGVAPEAAKALTRQALSEAAASGAATMVTTCQGCQRRFVPHEPKYPLTVETYVTLLGEALGIHRPDVLKRYVQYHNADRVIAEAAEAIVASGYERQDLEDLVRFYFR